MIPFTSEQKAVLRELCRLWADTPFCLVGAAALGCHLDRRWRRTEDLDICVSVSFDEFPAGLAHLPGWVSKREHEWMAPNGVRVDLIPAGPTLLKSGVMRWPGSDREMNLTGFRLAFERCVLFDIAPDVAVPVASLPVIALLKIVAYQDRPFERERDIEDLGYIFEEYAAAEDPRRWESDILDRQLDFDLVSAYLLGRDLVEMVNDEERRCIDRFLATLVDDRDPAQTAGRMLRVGPPRWRGDPTVLLGVMSAFELGLGRAVS